MQTQHKGFEQSVEQSLKHRQEQFEAPTSKNVLDALDTFNKDARKFAKSIADNTIVEWIPLVSPLIRSSLDMQEAQVALFQGKDVDTGKELSGPERAQVAVSKFGTSMWEQAKVGVDFVFLAVGGSIVEKLGLEGAGFVVKKGVEIAANTAVNKAGDFVVYGKDGRKVEISAKDPKMQAAEHVVDGMPGMYSEVAGMTKDTDTKKLLTDASSTFGKLTENPHTRTALAASLAQSEHMDDVMAKMAEFKNNPDAIKNFTNQIRTR